MIPVIAQLAVLCYNQMKRKQGGNLFESMA